jgi:hippurate hydrolase
MAELHDEITAWRREIHANPELMYDVEQTAASVAEKLKAFGCDEVVEGIGRTGVVGIIRGKAGSDHAIGLRADMDALPIEEESGKPWTSKNPGKMHACGHDGHTAMLLGAARYLAETRNFSGKVAVIFQPAEEGGAGGKAMVDDGMMNRFGIEEVYGMHNVPGLPVGHFAIRPGPIMASTDEFFVTVRGKGTHAAMPNLGIDVITIAAEIIGALQKIVSREVDPVDSLVVSVTQVKAGFAHNVLPDTALFSGTVRCLSAEVRDMAERRIEEIASGIAGAYGATIEYEYERSYPITVNHEDQTIKAIDAARAVAGDNGIITDIPPVLGGEDFSYMLLERPGAFIFVGNGDSAGLHNSKYDFNDEAIPHGASYWVQLVERQLPAA